MSSISPDHLCAHRGYHNAANDDDPERPLENTLAAYEQSFEHLRHAECDVQVTQDGIVVLAHDISLARVADLPKLNPSPPWSDKILGLFETVAAWYGLPESKRSMLRTKIPGELHGDFDTLLEVSPLLAKAGELSEHEFLSWSRELEISEAAHELLRALAPIERASRHKTPLDDLTLHYLAHRAVGDLTLDQIQMIPLKGGSRVPTLDAVLDCVVQNVQDHRHLVIEVKPGSPHVVEPLCELLSQRNMASQATIMSFDLDVIQAVALGVGRPSGQASTHRCLWLACTQDWDADAHGFTYAQVTQNPSSLEAVTETITKSGLDGIYIEYNDEIVTANVLAKLKAQGLFVGVWSSDPNHDCVATVTRLVLEGADLINTDEAITLPKALSEAS